MNASASTTRITIAHLPIPHVPIPSAKPVDTRSQSPSTREDLQVGDLQVGDFQIGDLHLGDLQVGDLSPPIPGPIRFADPEPSFPMTSTGVVPSRGRKPAGVWIERPVVERRQGVPAPGWRT